MIKFFRSSFLIQYFTLILITAALWVPAFINLKSLPEEPDLFTPLFTLAHYLLNLSEWASPVVGVAIIFISALTINSILVYHELTPKNNLLPALLFILLMSSNPDGLSTYAFIIALPVFTWFLHTIFRMNDEPENYLEVFNASVLISLISLIYLPAIVLFLFIWIVLLVYGIFNGRNLIISLIGVIIPYLYFFLYLFWTDRIDLAFAEYAGIVGGIFKLEPEKDIVQYLIWSIYAFFMLLPAFLRISGTLTSFNINLRKKLSATMWLLVFCVPLVILKGNYIYNTVVFVPAVILISHYFNLFKKSVMNEITLLAFFILLLINNYLFIFNA